MEIRLDGKVALITGASRGIGRAVAEAFVASGASVVLVSRKADALEALAATLDPSGKRVAWFAGNAGDDTAAEAAVEFTVDRFSGLHVLVNNAATNPHLGSTLDIDRAAFDKTVGVNWYGPLAWTRAAWRHAMAERGGVVCNIASIGGLVTEPGIGVYNGTKAALIHLTRQLARELAPSVRVNAVAPGLVKTDMARALWEPHEESIARRLPLGRLGEPADIAAAVTFLCSDAAAWITGSTLVVDGGALLGR